MNNIYMIYIYIYRYIYIYIVNFILAPFDVCFCADSFVFLLTQSSLSISRNLILSVSLGLGKIQLVDVAYKLTD